MNPIASRSRTPASRSQAAPSDDARPDDLLIVGGGIIGLSLAYELSGTGMRIRVLDQGLPGREASWAGSGILPPANRARAVHPLDQLRGLACELHPQWACQLREETGIDNGFRRCGGLYVGRSSGEAASLRAMVGMLGEQGIEVEPMEADQVAECEPALAPLAASDLRAAIRLPGECQFRNPDHLQALLQAIQRRGVVVEAETPVRDITTKGNRISGVVTDHGPLVADCYCITAGAWTVLLLKKLGISTGILPVRGQMLLFKLPRRLFSHVINEGPRYLVPRDDGYVLAGSTEEEEGFDKSNTQEGLAELARFASGLVGQLNEQSLEKAWAGLRPGSFDGFPYLGRLPGLENALAAAGHFRSGLWLAPATARVMAQLITHQQPEIPLDAFSLNRG